MTDAETKLTNVLKVTSETETPLQVTSNGLLKVVIETDSDILEVCKRLVGIGVLIHYKDKDTGETKVLEI